ncbi:MAG: Peptide ABC transporter permease [uncultured Thiotrichaceae bacterium]|uniref:Peptide ABC transporter permease n=1 Tax=uncultured Thiotrichaceae bacterium TaxID=298394 RepID=A0A6S6T570_9GAMM|nr:MAG: Peptide ABC transporter permease [uncultured Thiotrichaceae bacterium]
MRASDNLQFSGRALTAYPMRTGLILLAMSIGVASVIILTTLGEGARQYVVGQFQMLGSHLLFVLPGRTETTGGLPPLLGTSPRDLTIDDALALKRSRSVQYVSPNVTGAAPVSYGAREREVMVFGTNNELFDAVELKILKGQFLPEADPRDAVSISVLGETLAKELFGKKHPVGEWIRVGDHRFRVIGVLSSEGQSIGMDMKDVVIIPVASAQSLFNIPSLYRIIVKARSKEALDQAEKDVIKIIRARHDGDDDVTILRQDALLKTFDGILKTLTWAVAGVAAISLIVAGILIMNVMLVSVSQRKAEIGLLKALGAPTRQVMTLFLSEALMLSLAGGLIGLALGLFSAKMVTFWIADFPVQTPMWAIGAALLVTVVTGLVFGSIPARQAAKLNPVIALSGK